LHDNLTRGGVERQRAQEDDTDQSLAYHDPISFCQLRNEAVLPDSSSSEGVIDNQQNHGPDNRDEKTIEVKAADAASSENVEKPSAGKSADNT
jgi:hypothetical protein